MANDAQRLAGIARRWLLGATLLLTPLLSAADSRSMRFEHLSRADGLSQAFVYAIEQDAKGFMWFGTQEGLNRWDGYTFTVFAHDPADPGSISDESIRTLLVSSDGTLWVGTDAGGLSRYDAASETFTNFMHDPADENSLADNRVRVLFEDSEGALWIGTDGSGLDRFDAATGSFVHYPADPADGTTLAGGSVWGMAESVDGSLWIATDTGLSRLDRDSGRFTSYRHDANDPYSLSDDRLRALFIDRQGNLWIGTEAGGLNRYDRGSDRFERFRHAADDPSSLSHDRVTTIFEDNAGVLWVGTLGGLNAWNPVSRSFDRYVADPGNPYSLSHDTIMSLFQDRAGVLWIGSYDGLCRWNPATRAMLHFRHEAGDEYSLSENTVTTFAEDPTGRIWVGTFGGGISVLDRPSGRFSVLRHDPADSATLSGDRVMALHVSRGAAWAGMRAAGLNRIDLESGEIVRFRHDPEDPDSLSADGVTYVLEGRNGDLWVATFGGGLNLLDRATGTFRHFRHDPEQADSLSNDRVLVLFEDSAGVLWAGTYGGGLNRYDPASGTFARFTAADGLAGDEIYMLQEDVRGDLWIGVKGLGLNRWPRDARERGEASFDHLTEIDGLPSSTVYSGQWDSAGHLWLSSARGLSRLDVDTLEFRNYDTSHGLQGYEFNLAAGYRAANGELFFGGMNGFNAFQPGSLNGNQTPPPVVISSVLTFNEPLDLVIDNDTSIELTHDQDVVGFEFAALDFAAPGKNRFMYRLDGVDEEWIDAGTRRYASYNNLAHGDYTFRVRAANYNGIWSEADATLGLTITPAWWNSPFAYLVYVLTLSALLAGAVRGQAARIRQAARVRHAEEIHTVQGRLQEAQRIASIGNWEWDIDTNELWWSAEVYRLFQLDPRSFEATYEAFLDHVHPEDRGPVNDAVRKALANEEPYSIDHRIVRPDGTERIVHERAEVTFDKKGEPVRMAGTVHDITERKAAEDEIRRRADFQGLLASLSSDLIRAEPEAVAKPLKEGLAAIGKRYGLDEILVAWCGEDELLEVSNRWSRVAPVKQTDLNQSSIPWTCQQLMAGDTVTIDDVSYIPDSANRDRKAFQRVGYQSLLAIPLLIDNRKGACFFATRSRRTAWSPETQAELRLVAEAAGGAIARASAMIEIRQLRDQLEEENLYLRETIKLAHGFDEIVGEDEGLTRCLQAVEKVAPTDVAVLITGETGTGKELIARAIHKLSARSDGPMVSVNCPALPANLIESELFGHEKGAFTGADNVRRGRFEIAEGGTIFLDEIGELPLDLQAKLLRVLQTGEFERLGGVETMHADVRLLAATNRNLEESIKAGEFRADLYFRISSFPIHLPPLRDRTSDIPALAEHFVLKHSKRLNKDIRSISARMLRDLADYDWPGNVRELESTIERAMISSSGEVLNSLTRSAGRHGLHRKKSTWGRRPERIFTTSNAPTS